MTVGELRTKMSSLEYSQWATFYYVEQQERDKQRAMAEAEAKKKENEVMGSSNILIKLVLEGFNKAKAQMNNLGKKTDSSQVAS